MPNPNPAPGDAVMFYAGRIDSLPGSAPLSARITQVRAAGYIDLEVVDAGVSYTRNAIPLLGPGDEAPRHGSWAKWPEA